MSYGFKRSVISSDPVKEKRLWYINYGPSWKDGGMKTATVECTDQELAIVCDALVAGALKTRQWGGRSIACVAGLNHEPSPHEEPDYLFCDCM